VAQVADRKHGIPAPATTSTVRSADWDGRDLSGERHEKVAFIDVDLSETVDNGGVFTECAFRGARFNVSRHANAAFVNCTFTRCSFFDATDRRGHRLGSGPRDRRGTRPGRPRELTFRTGSARASSADRPGSSHDIASISRSLAEKNQHLAKSCQGV
jgi:hypothetical protein